jgi:hypothetical protein
MLEVGLEYYVISFVLDFDSSSTTSLNKNSIVGSKLLSLLWQSRSTNKEKGEGKNDEKLKYTNPIFLEQRMKEYLGDRNLEMLENCTLSNDFLPFLQFLSHDRQDWNQSNRSSLLNQIQEAVQHIRSHST